MSSWRFEDDPLTQVAGGSFIEVPISSFRTTPLFYWRLAAMMKLGGVHHSPYGKGRPIGQGFGEKLTGLVKSRITPVSMDGYKSSSLSLAAMQYLEKKREVFVPIGHPKLITPFSIGCLNSFIAYIGSQVNFVGFSDLQL